MKFRGFQPDNRSFGLLHSQREMVGLSYPLLVALGGLSALAGLGQASLLVVVVRIATALTAQTEQITGRVGPLTATELTTNDLLWLGAALLGTLFVIELIASRCQARLYATAHRTTQRKLLTAYSNAHYAAQSRTDRGDTQQLLHVHAGQTASLVNAIGNGVSAAANFVILVLAALILSPIAAVAVLGGLAVMLLLLRPLLHKSKHHGDARASSQRKMASLLSERLELNREIRSFGAEATANAAIHQQIDEVADTFERLRFISRINSVAYRLGAFALILAMLAVISATDSTSLTALTGALLMLLRSLSYGQATQGALQSASEALPVFSQLVVEFERLESAERCSGEQRHPHAMGVLRLDDVSFAYTDAVGDGVGETAATPHHGGWGLDHVGSPALNAIDLTIDRGEFVALVGPSGSGKSTLMSLLLGLQQPTSGALLLDDIDVADISSAWWHKNVAFVPQEPKLSSGSVREAIRFGRRDITNADVERAARRAHIADEIEQLPLGWDTEVGTLGDQVSGGQRQRIAIARAIAGSPKLLLLDEPTSALDERSEALISNTILSLRDSTSIVAIAHRPRTIEHADRVVHIVNGRISNDREPRGAEIDETRATTDPDAAQSSPLTLSLDDDRTIKLDPLQKVEYPT